MCCLLKSQQFFSCQGKLVECQWLIFFQSFVFFSFHFMRSATTRSEAFNQNCKHPIVINFTALRWDWVCFDYRPGAQRGCGSILPFQSGLIASGQGTARRHADSVWHSWVSILNVKWRLNGIAFPPIMPAGAPVVIRLTGLGQVQLCSLLAQREFSCKSERQLLLKDSFVSGCLKTWLFVFFFF